MRGRKKEITHHQLSIRKILAECDSHEEEIQLNLKKCNLTEPALQQQSTSWLKCSINSNSSVPEDYEMDLTKYRYRNVEKKQKLMFNLDYSPLPPNSAQLVKTKSLKIQSKSLEKKPKKNIDQMKSTKNIFPNLLAKFRRSRSPANASISNKISIYDQSKKNDDETQSPDKAYDAIKTEREKLEEMRKIMILGRIINENFRKGVKQINSRRNRLDKQVKN